MTSDSRQLEKVTKYMRYLDDDELVQRGLERLAKIDVTIDLLQKTGVGKVVNRLRADPTLGDLADSIVNKWKKTAMIECEKEHRSEKSEDSRSSKDSKEKRRKRETSREKDSNEKHHRKSSHAKEAKASRKRCSAPSQENDFAAMLTMVDKTPVIHLKKKPRFSINTADFDTDYKPFTPKTLAKKTETYIAPTLNYAPVSSATPPVEEYDPSLFKYKSSDRVRVFAGRKKGSTVTFVDSLYNLSMKVLSNNIDAIQHTHNVPFDILRPVLVKCTTTQLANIEALNPLIAEDSDCLWEDHFHKAHPGEKSHHNETWKEAYFRMQREKNNRLKMLSERITSTHKEESLANSRKAMLSAAIAPRNVRRKQISNGIQYKSSVMPDALAVSRARKEVADNGSKSSLNALPSAVKNINSNLGASKATKKDPPKKGALMMKTLKMLNIKRR